MPGYGDLGFCSGPREALKIPRTPGGPKPKTALRARAAVTIVTRPPPIVTQHCYTREKAFVYALLWLTTNLETKAIRESEEAEDSLVAFFESLDESSRAEYQELADRDRRFGEDLDAERAAVAKGTGAS